MSVSDAFGRCLNCGQQCTTVGCVNPNCDRGRVQYVEKLKDTLKNLEPPQDLGMVFRGLPVFKNTLDAQLSLCPECHEYKPGWPDDWRNKPGYSGTQYVCGDCHKNLSMIVKK